MQHAPPEDAASDGDIDGQEDGEALVLPSVLDLKAAAPLAGEFLARRGSDITVDASAVQRLGGQCLQVLLSAQQCWAEEARVLRIANPSPEFRSQIALFAAGALLSSNPKES